MKKSDFILEIGTEELPASYIQPALEQLKELFIKSLNGARIDFSDVKTYATNRRLVVYILKVSDKQKEKETEIIGPPKNKAFDTDGNPTSACIGFAKSHDVSSASIRIKQTPKGEYIYILKKEIQNKTTEVLAGIISGIITSIQFPKSMRWFDSTKFARPIRWILALYGKNIIKFKISDVTSGPFTYCHRFLSSGKKKVKEANEYFKILKKGFCIVDNKEREKTIIAEAEKLAKEIGGKPISDKNLLNELVYLTEYPKVFLCEFDKNFLKLPAEVLVQVMKHHQKYIPIINSEGNLLNNFIVATNGIKNNIIKLNNERVLKARFKDAEFFYNEDIKIPLINKAEGKLKKVIWQENLGTLFDKSERLSKLTAVLAEELHLETNLKEILKSSSKLAKADLVTELVKEFPELQGNLGRVYALKSGEKREVADCLVDQYLPGYDGDVLPLTKCGSILSIAEKIDNIVGCFLIGLTPTGSTDPYGLRRHAIGFINIVLNKNIDFSLKDLIKKSIELFISNYNGPKEDLFKSGAKFRPPLEALIQDTALASIEVDRITCFIKERFENILLDKKFKYDCIRAVLNSGFDSIFDSYKRVTALSNLRNTESNFNEIITAFSRVINILPKKEYKNIFLNIDRELLREDEEKKLLASFFEIKTKVEKLFEKKDYENGFKETTRLKIDIDNFFDKVMVMVEDEKIKNNRLSILKNINELFLKFADFSYLVI